MTYGERTVVGWRERLCLPELNIEEIDSKVDTGTRLSILHSSFIESYRQQGQLWVRFGVQPFPDDTSYRLVGLAPVKETRLVSDYNGEERMCFVIETSVRIGEYSETIELTLTTDDAAKFKMVLGRTALQALQLVVDPSLEYALTEKEPGSSEEVRVAL